MKTLTFCEEDVAQMTESDVADLAKRLELGRLPKRV